jgi:aspartokinase-like uncharacterized kinase
MTLPLRVIKLGGSLLLYDGLASAWRTWLQRQTPAANLLIAGGGGLVDGIRAFDERHCLVAADSHELAIACLSVTARMLSCLLPEAPLLVEADALIAWRRAERGVAIFDLCAAWRDPAWRPALGALPFDWNTTSDSLAAVVAARLEASELVLLKSADPPAVTSLIELAATDFVDCRLSEAAKGLTIRCVNLRENNPAERCWTASSE